MGWLLCANSNSNKTRYPVLYLFFTNRRRNAVKILAYDGTGFWLVLKRFSSGKLKWWPSVNNSAQSTYSIDATQLTILVNQGHPLTASLEEPWRKIKTAVPDGS